MRKITQRAVTAFLNRERFGQGNTQVIVGMHCDVTSLLLHGRLIARLDDTGLNISSGGWQTATTKERLNALPGVRVHQKNYTWYLNGHMWNGGYTNVKEWSELHGK
ncbi:MAG: hypothetical protein PHQ22_10795 [Sulfuricurvum sp.]|nr:hypothetical protein [Sulfuricurvum sp.]